MRMLIIAPKFIFASTLERKKMFEESGPMNIYSGICFRNMMEMVMEARSP